MEEMSIKIRKRYSELFRLYKLKENRKTERERERNRETQ